MSSELTEVELTGDAFREASSKRVTLLGMSGVGKTRLANVLRDQEWFHYSVDYRIGTRYLSEPILDNIKREAMSVPFLRKLLRTDSIYISNNITFDNLKPLSTFLGMLGNPEQGGIALSEFKRRQALHLDAEIGATLDVSDFINKAVDIYGYPHFLNDASGSFCEIDDESVFEAVARDTVIIYIEASPEDEKILIRRAVDSPKPLYYREDFLDNALARYMEESSLEYVAQVDPNDFVAWVFPHLFKARLPRYKHIADTYGYTVPARKAFEVTSPEEFVELVAGAIDATPAKTQG
jgi:hypothetical protein